MPVALRSLFPNLERAGTVPAEAGAHLADIIRVMLEKKASGTDMEL